MKTHLLKAICGSLLGCAISMTTYAQTIEMQINASRTTNAIGSRHYGLFFEEINHAGDGGLYAELIQNRSFEDNIYNPDKWWTVGSANMSLISEGLLNDVQSKALRVKFNANGDGIKNEGFWGINAVKDRTYTCSFWVKSNTWNGTLTAAICNENGTRLGETAITVSASTEWKKYTATITCNGDDPKAWFFLTADKAGSLDIDMVSLFPPTFKDRPNGCRPDLAQLLYDMKPAFVRFPGGCFVEGAWADGQTNRFEWKKTIGPIEERPGHRNVNWNYRVSDGMGFHEMLQLTEDLGAEPLFVVNMGMGHGWCEPYTEIDEYIQEALDAIEYCNGDVNTKWGALRAANGHPEPFNLNLIEIGNENYNFSSQNNNDQSDHYAERYIQFYNAIKERYPEMTIIGNVEAWGTDSPSWRNPHPVDAVDEHYYRSPDWFTSQYNKYDSYSRSSHKIYVGEYAVTQNFGDCGNLDAALGEAVFMLGMERNADVCVMNSYAPIFVNENDQKWRPDMIRFNSEISYGTPSYYVQKLMPNNIGTHNLSYTEKNVFYAEDGGQIGMSTWATTAQFDNVRLTDENGQVIFSDDFQNSANSKWIMPQKGTWNINNGVLEQTNPSTEGSICYLNIDGMSSYTFEADATKLSGAEGFLIVFNYKDDQNYAWWNLGGWGNTKHGVEICRNGSKTTVTDANGSIESGRTYRVKIQVKGSQVTCYLDDTVIHQFTINQDRKIYTAVNIDQNDNQMYVKIVNTKAQAQTVRVNVDNATVENGTVIQLTATSNKEENNVNNPYNVTPKEQAVTTDAEGLTYEVPAYSLNIIKLKVSDIQEDNTPDPELPDPVVAYTFENGQPADDNNQYEGSLTGSADIIAMNDGNKVLYTGNGDNGGWMDLGSDMAKQILSQLTGDFTITADIMFPGIGSLEKYCWALAMANGTDEYLGLVNTSNNTDWYFTMKDKESGNEYARSKSGISYGKWHTLTFVMEGNKGSFYLDGYKLSESEFSSRPEHFASTVTLAALGRSPYADDAIMKQMAIDNVRFYSQALNNEQVKKIYQSAEKMDAQSSEIINNEDVSEIAHFISKFNFLHASTDLPAETENGATITWSCDITENGYVELTEENGKQRLNVLQLPAADSKALQVAQLTATLHHQNGTSSLKTQPVILAPDDNRYGYLYCFMNANKEITNFALGTKEDKGQNFKVLLGGTEIFDTEEIAGIEHGTRDAYITRGEDNDGYLMTTTDMKQHASGIWNNHGLNLIKSKDLIHWESVTFDFNKGKQIFSDPEATTGCYDTDEEYAKINRVWAPQVIWDPSVQKYLVYYSILSSNEGDSYDKIYYSYADRDFKTLTQPRLFFDPGRAVIDGDIVYNPYDGLYHMYYKREGASGATRGIYEATSPTLVSDTWTDILHITNEGEEQVEGSSTIRRINEDVYNVYYMRYSGGSAYKYCETDHLGQNISFSSNLQGDGAFQHGSFMTLTETEYKMLESWSKLCLFLPEIEKMAENGNSQVLNEAIATAKEALALTSVEQLATELPKAYDTLLEARETYLEELFSNLEVGETTDITSLLKNPDFSQGTYGWNGTAFTQATAGVAEHYNKTFDTYQVLENMPAGEYIFSCQGFYRYGGIQNASTAHQNGTEALLAKIYINDQTDEFMSLYDETDYSLDPYTFPDNVTSANNAFNKEDNYHGNTVTYTLNETSDLKLGISKTEFISQDWTCFDNFKLYYKRTNADAIQQIDFEKSMQNADVYTVSGVLVRSGVNSKLDIQDLPVGVYILKSGNKSVKIMK